MSNLLIHIRQCIVERNSDSSCDIVLSPDSQLSLTVTSKLSGLPFRWKFHARPVSLHVVMSLIIFVHVVFAWLTCPVIHAQFQNMTPNSNFFVSLHLFGSRLCEPWKWSKNVVLK